MKLPNEITGICIDSRKIVPGDLYVCIEGLTVDGHAFADQAVANGAVAVLLKEGKEHLISANVPKLTARDTRLALAFACKQFFGDPTKDMKLIGITGTNGKSSTVAYLEQILCSLGKKVGGIGTLGARVNGAALDIPFVTSTTPDTVELYRILAAMKQAGAQYVVMEVTSHALALEKVAALDFTLGLFTNLSQDHLDFHGTMENYAAAKAKLFDLSRAGIINNDDEASRDFLLEYTKGKIAMTTYGLRSSADYFANSWALKPDGVEYSIDEMGIDVPIPGKFTIYNTLCAYAACRHLGFSPAEIAAALKMLSGVGGRIQSIPNNKGFTVVVDYAHTPDSLVNIINACREFTKGRIITVFGCGGDRDPIKRPIMGEIAGRLSDQTVITSDNPRNEDPAAIIEQIAAGLVATGRPYVKIVDRREAIGEAIKLARAGDCVIIAGKGHENYQEFENNKRIHFDDAEFAKQFLED